ncbi:uncharacterized protein PGTG_06526 [Puccinia graminis f. sp. tritici CRL 75-36-700-3]|uniref:Uncharacterized protein n=1 Tax=Puccinia graminis f. sp. tritici (strain CRL 75-36-700-3 / race SCCL) TaxID=418459 RepID=E3K933_PUCGT|nr:uncharacterized protein PGTG_06526 [Puccinia graminis f. sp. tritici CRL 75-36-700-3]EFP80570.2 hypothetical protein PGTG_06526 [Puccinia graminis f. sp. tritici CRL 75-36-700-3]
MILCRPHRSHRKVDPCLLSTQSTPAVDTLTNDRVAKSPSTSVKSHSGVNPASSKKSSSKSAKTSAKKKIKSPEVVPSDWDSSNEVESEADKSCSNKTIAPKLDKSSVGSDPIKNNETAKKLTDTDIWKSIHIHKNLTNPAPLTEKDPIGPKLSETAVATGLSQSTQPNDPSSVQVINNQQVQSFPKISGDAAVQKKIENYFVPQGRTVRSESTTSSAQPSLSFTTEPYEPASESDLDIITGATAQLWSKPKTSKGRLGDNILAKYPRPLHPLLQSVRLYQEYYRQAKEKNDEDMKVVAISKASELQDDLSDKINPQDFKDLFGNWDPKAECEEYLTGPTGRKYKRSKDIPVTPTPDPEMQVDPPTEVPPLHQGTSQQYQQGYYSQQGYQYPQAYQQLPQAGQYFNAASPYYPQPVANTAPVPYPHVPTSEVPPNRNNQNRNRNRNRNTNRRSQAHRAPNNFRPMSANGTRQRTNSQTARENRRVAYQRSIHQEMIRLSRTTQAQYQALEAMREQSAGYGNRHQPQEGGANRNY